MSCSNNADLRFYRNPDLEGGIERNMYRPLPSSGRKATARPFYQHPPHQESGNAKKVRAVLPTHLPLIDQTQERLVHQGPALDLPSGRFAAQVVESKPLQLAVDQGGQTLQSVVLSPAPGLQQTGDRSVGHRWTDTLAYGYRL